MQTFDPGAVHFVGNHVIAISGQAIETGSHEKMRPHLGRTKEQACEAASCGRGISIVWRWFTPAWSRAHKRWLSRNLQTALLLIIAVASVHTGSRQLSAAPQNCVVAEFLRLKLDGIEYRIPAELQPTYTPSDVIPTRDHFPNGLRTKQYCQSPQAVAPDVRGITFGSRSLSAAQQRDASYGTFAGVPAVTLSPAIKTPLRRKPEGELTSDGLFYRIDHNGWYELNSTRPMLFGAPISVFCNRFGVSNALCRLIGQVENGSRVKINISDRYHPPETWPALLSQVQVFLASLMPPREP